MGKRIGDRLARLGITTVAELAAADDDRLAAEFGPTNGPGLARLGRGGGRSRPDDTPWVPRAHGRETTYQADLVTPEEVRAALDELAARVVEDVRAEDRPVQRVLLKIRFAPFFTVTRVRKLTEPTYDPQVLAQTAYDLYLALDDPRPVRLLGVRGEMVPPPGGY